jgi:hypothetical protein
VPATKVARFRPLTSKVTQRAKLRAKQRAASVPLAATRTRFTRPCLARGRRSWLARLARAADAAAAQAAVSAGGIGRRVVACRRRPLPTRCRSGGRGGRASGAAGDEAQRGDATSGADSGRSGAAGGWATALLHWCRAQCLRKARAPAEAREAVAASLAQQPRFVKVRRGCLLGLALVLI